MSHQNSGSRGRSSRPNNHLPSRNNHVQASNPSANESVGNLDENSLGRGRGRGRSRGKYSYNVSQGSGSKNLNDKHNSNLVYRPKRPDVISNSIEAEGMHKKQPESKDIVDSDSVYRGDHHSLSARSDSQNIQQGVGRIKIAETPQKEAKGSATKNLYLHKEEVTYMQEESPPQPLKHLNDKNNSKSVYQPESKDVVDSDSVYSGVHHSLSAHSDSQNIQRGVGRIKIAETPQKEAEGSATKNLYLHKEEVTCMQEESPPQPLKHLNDKNNSKSVYQPESNDVVDSDSVYRGDHHSLSAHSDSQNLKQGVGRIKIAETPQKEAEGSATKNLYLHKEEVTYKQEESLQSLKVETKGQTSEEKGSKNSTCIGDSGHSVQEAGFKLDLCPPKKGSPFTLKPSLLVKNRQKRNEVKRATEGQIASVLRPGMVLLKNFLSFSDQVNILKTCRDLGLGPGGFYQPGYREGASLHLKMMCLGKNWDPEKKVYEDIRSTDSAIPPTIPAEFNQLVEKAIHDSRVHIERNHGLRNAAYKLPSMSPDICIVNFYSATGKLGLHQDRDETQESLNKGLPVVSFSVGNTAEFLYGDERDVDKATKVLLESGDVLIFGGKSRHIFHGVEAILPNTTPPALQEETNFCPGRLNLTFRQY
ncbi:hypothetical protein QYF36_003141 [Acer negundo]|nr:hypothetical protein QYF36_003141 [Acer negundo]